MSGKVLVVGLDGATWEIMRPLMEDGRLPNFAHLIEGGVHGNLLSTIPILTPPAWTSLFTGTNPGKHGVFDFFVPQRDYTRILVNSRHRRSKALWTILSEWNRKVGVVNVPVTYPPERVNGFMITGMLTPGVEKEFTYPRHLKKELLEVVPGYKIDFDERLFHARGDRERFLEDILDGTEKSVLAVTHLMKEKAWDFFAVVFMGLDRVQHFWWEYMGAGPPLSKGENAVKHRDVIPEYYRYLDRIMGEMLENIDQETAVMVVSDHGFGPLFKDYYINNWLVEEGLLRCKDEAERVPKSPVLRRRTARLLNKCGLKGVLKPLLKRFRKEPSERRPAFVDAVDWSRTKACLYSLSGQYILLNLRGRQRDGVVQPGREYEELRDHIVDGLHKLKDPETGEKIVERAYRREEIYSGPNVESAPDILVLTRRGYTFQEGFGRGGIVSTARQGVVRRSGDHRREGILVMKGPNIREGVKIEDTEIVDIAPTILCYMGLPRAEDMDGKIVTEAFEPELREKIT